MSVNTDLMTFVRRSALEILSWEDWHIINSGKSKEEVMFNAVNLLIHHPEMEKDALEIIEKLKERASRVEQAMLLARKKRGE